ncbi:acyl-CoA dehydrogenase family protein [Terricaulis sp.]|uniref:acyl-CoA dehydrogenase family protein n=1 Tax=Terricaulis sp. TaxID=2768686 RepID=UPI002AC3D268|nr:acyl-CoA dehydrogenase family protein [Terricaulis sp.]MDZ4692575.1 acyl-CoA dehydrogenase family protein [Terricaulis sp.]
MNFEHSANAQNWINKVQGFMDEHVYPAVPTYEAQQKEGSRWKVLPVVEELKAKAKAQGLWNMFMPPSAGAPHVDDTFEFEGPRLTNLEYAPLAELMGRVAFGSEVFNCSAPDTGNMEVFERYGTRAQKDKWLKPLMNGEIRSAFLMTEPAVASSDATNIQCEIKRDGDDYVINGRKWWSSGAGDPRCKVAILMGKTNPDNPKHSQQSQILVPLDAKGITMLRALTVFGYDDAPHGHMEIELKNVRVPVENLLLGEGRGFEIAQGRLGPGRIHHCMRTIGAAEAALEALCKRITSRVAFGKTIAEHSVWEERIADARIDIEMTRLLCLKAADMMDRVGNKVAKNEIAMIKVAAPRMALKIIDDAIQAHGGAGVCQDFGLAKSYAGIRTLRLADGPDEVHARTIALNELAKYGWTGKRRKDEGESLPGMR